MTHGEIIILIVVIGTQLIVEILRRVLPSYLSEKGKNLATKQDIGEITNRIEGAKTQYLLAIESKKSDLTFYSITKGKITERAIESIIAFFEDCIELYANKLMPSFGDLPIDDGQGVNHQIDETKALFKKTFIDYHRVGVYFNPNDTIYIKTSELLYSIIEIEKIYNRHIGAIKRTIIEEMYVAKNQLQKDRYKECVEQSDKESSDYLKEIEPRISDFREKYLAYVHSMQSILRINKDSILNNTSLL